MRKILLLFLFGLLMSLGTFAQLTEVIKNGSFELPSGGTKIDLATGSIPNWYSDDKTANHTNREGGNPATISLSNTSKGLYQVIDKVPSSLVGYKVSFASKITWDGSTQDTVIMTAKLTSFKGSSRTSRVKIDSLNFLMSHTTGNNSPWQHFNGVFLIPAGSQYTGDSVVVELGVTKWTHNPTDNNIWSLVDSVSVLKALFSDMNITNGSFELPTGGAKIDLSTGKIPGWNTEDVAANHNNREGGTPATVSMVNTSAGIYNVIDKIPATSTVYNVNFAWTVTWDGSTQDTVTMTAKLSSFKGSNRTNRTKIDSLNFQLSHATGNNTPWKRFAGAFSIPDLASYSGDSLALEFKVTKWTHNPTENNLWSLIDSVSVLKAGSGPFVNVTGIALSTATHDSLEINRSITMGATITPADATNKTLTWSIAAADTALATINASGILTAKGKKGTVTVTAASVSNPTISGSKTITIFKTNVTSISLSAPDTIEVASLVPVTATILPVNASDKSLKWTVSNTKLATIDASGKLTTLAKGDIVVTATSVSDTTISATKKIRIKQSYIYTPLTVVNSGFELPDDNTKYQIIGLDQIPGWHSEDVVDNHNGRESGSIIGRYQGYSNNIALPIYQAVDVVSDKASTYLLTYLARSNYLSVATDSMFAVAYFSHYKPGTSRHTRSLIDSVEVNITSSGLTLVKAPITIPANATYKNDSLVIELKLKTYDATHVINPANTNSWYNMDSVSFLKLLPVVHATSISLSFELAGDSVQIGSSALMGATFSPADVSFTDVRWSVSDPNIASIDSLGNLTAKAKGVVTVTATAVNDPGVKATKNIKVYKKSGVGVNTLVAGEISAYPNPSDGNFTLNAPASSEVSVFDVNGKVIYSIKTTTDKTPIGISGSGMYMIQIKTNDGNVINKKVLVK